jgi:hypothetical protein
MGSGTSSPGSRFRVDMAPDAVGPCSPVLSSSNHVSGFKSSNSNSNATSPHPPLLATSPPPLETVPEMNGIEFSDGAGSGGSDHHSPARQEVRAPPLSQGVPSIELPEGEFSIVTSICSRHRLMRLICGRPFCVYNFLEFCYN